MTQTTTPTTTKTYFNGLPVDGHFRYCVEVGARNIYLHRQSEVLQTLKIYTNGAVLQWDKAQGCYQPIKFGR